VPSGSSRNGIVLRWHYHHKQLSTAALQVLTGDRNRPAWQVAAATTTAKAVQKGGYQRITSGYAII